PVSRMNELRALLNPGGRIAIAYQPRGPGSTDETARRAGNEIAEHFANAGFTDVRVETLPLKPTAVVCVLGVRPGPGRPAGSAGRASPTGRTSGTRRGRAGGPLVTPSWDGRGRGGRPRSSKIRRPCTAPARR